MKTATKISAHKPQIKVYPEFCGVNHNARYWIGYAKIKFPDGEELNRRGCLPFAEELNHKGKTYLCRYYEKVQAKIQAKQI